MQRKVKSASSQAYSPTFSTGTLSIVTCFLPVPIRSVVLIFTWLKYCSASASIEWLAADGSTQ